jgi:hypothetical protein
MLGRDRVGRPSAWDTGEHSTPAAGGRDPLGGGGSAPTEGDLAAPKHLHGCYSRPSVGTAPGRIPAPSRALQPVGCDP